MRKLFSLFGAMVLGSMVLFGTFVMGMRTKHPAVQDRVRQFNKRVGNPRMLRTAGQPGAWASIVRHTGRRSGNVYETPVEANPTDDGFVIPLPYGATSDWVKNVLATGRATLVREGETFEVNQPEIVPTIEVADVLPDREQKMLKMFDVKDCLQLHRVALVAAAS